MDDPFNEESVINIITGEEIDHLKMKYLLDVEVYGEKLYTEYQTERLIKKTMPIFDKISRPVLSKKKSFSEVTVNTEKESMQLIRIVDIARARGYDLKILFSYEITSTSLFLSLPNGTIRTPTSKSDLLKEIRVMTLSILLNNL